MNEHFQTGVLHIYAAGDVIARSKPALPLLAGRLAGCHMFGKLWLDVAESDSLAGSTLFLKWRTALSLRKS